MVQFGRPPSPEQLEYARDLGIDIPFDANSYDLRILLSAEIKRRGREVWKSRAFHEGMTVVHPTRGACRIDSLRRATLKAVLAPVGGGNKITIDVYRLTEFEVI